VKHTPQGIKSVMLPGASKQTEKSHRPDTLPGIA